VEQVQAPIAHSGWQTQKLTYNCTGSTPYFWGVNQGADVTNWCLDDETIAITLACPNQFP
jgi:hypothetical protein